MIESGLAGMAAMVGEWETTTTLFPEVTGRTTIEWLGDEAFLLVRYTAPDPSTSRIWVVGADEAAPGRLVILQHDQNGGHRIYHGSFEGPLWRVWRDAPGASQRFTGSLDETGNTLHATWERSDSELDPRTWEHELDLVHTRIS
ncbi:hypothetical protein [Nocardia sp. X0981]